MSTLEAPRGLSPRVRIQIVLVLLIFWEAIGLLAELGFGGPLIHVSDGKVTGVLAPRLSLGGALVVPLTLYIYALVRGAMRYRGLLWIGVLEQSMVVLFAVFHGIAGDIEFGSALVPVGISAGLLALLLANMPRGQITS
jgi:hypothetical protein